MKDIRFAHISDTHIRRDYRNASVDFFDPACSPQDALGEILTGIAGKKDRPDFVLFSGDLVHEGDAEDYALFRQIVEEALGDIPAFFVLGNHDRRAAYYQGKPSLPGLSSKPGGPDGPRPYYYSAEIRGLRLIVLDSGVDKSGGHSGVGFIDGTQLAWLRGELGRKSPLGSILVLHHPPCIELQTGMLSHCLSNSRDLKDVLEGSDVRAIFSGHTHQNSVTTFSGIPHFTAGSSAFGIMLDDTHIHITNRRDYNECLINERGLYVHTETPSDSLKTLSRIAIADLMKALEGLST
ncbi:MAG: metallophosphoesterase [Treponema sp.]|jgi:3',5'-cyclic AMP phosphodiesterase CpdA|nr:metallophosphoesterase [Treponema sp.]